MESNKNQLNESQYKYLKSTQTFSAIFAISGSKKFRMHALIGFILNTTFFILKESTPPFFVKPSNMTYFHKRNQEGDQGGH